MRARYHSPFTVGEPKGHVGYRDRPLHLSPHSEAEEPQKTGSLSERRKVPIAPTEEAVPESASASAQTATAEFAAVTDMPRILAALRFRDFRQVWVGNFLSNVGTWMQNVAQGWLVLELTNSAFWLGVVGFAGSIPFLAFTLFGGVIADRVDKRRLLLVTQTVMMILAFVLAGLAWFKWINVWGVATIAFLNGVAMAMNAPSYQALVPRLVKREDLTNAIALNSAQFNMSRILGPTLGGYAMMLFGGRGTFCSTGSASSR